ncbi:homogentisate 1,2-dioxygenase [Hahella sp. KA22]|uniref:homogentisate 1,2-dioxygenase n=1 Tax=Hahella sp. KA22 TaxID=1628392 RepID=UPI000FDDF198|nr:homogentisate 1,2-dioxygenase [Hahella sp. KA22]AZZ90388.1 homogentisate 1,2-dioxygenase [Hahella sp. KA22]QAY53758.1 homogentisate 1,2-dioxygenase [Hahella sp. KA22]
MRKWISFPHKEGLVSRQAHADLPSEAIYEREAGRSGFFGPTAHFHHKRPPTDWDSWEGPLRPRAFDLNRLNIETKSPFDAPVLLHNTHCQYRYWRCTQKMDTLARNADGDDLFFIHEGEGDFFCDYGRLTVREGDYIVLPRSTMWRLEPKSPITMLMIEATNDSYQLPEKGLVGPQAIFDPAMLDVPRIDDAFLAQQDDTQWVVEIKRRNAISRVTYPYSPLDALGWHGDLSVVRINWRDIRPLASHRYHLPPSAHSTFVASRFVVCTFVPRPIESDPGALKVPFYHNNDDFDEVIFYHQGNFFSRDNIGPAMVTFHPSGFTHGPHPKAFAAGLEYTRKETDEVAVMLDTRDALEVGPAACQVETIEYADSWKMK